MQKWEYWSIKQSRNYKDLLAGGNPESWKPEVNLSKLGNEGWELVSAFSLSGIAGEVWSGVTNEVVWVFKRPIE